MADYRLSRTYHRQYHFGVFERFRWLSTRNSAELRVGHVGAKFLKILFEYYHVVLQEDSVLCRYWCPVVALLQLHEGLWTVVDVFEMAHESVLDYGLGWYVFHELLGSWYELNFEYPELFWLQ